MLDIAAGVAVKASLSNYDTEGILLPGYCIFVNSRVLQCTNFKVKGHTE